MHEFFYPNYYYYRSRRLKPPQQGAWRTRSRVSAGWSSWWCPPFASTSKPATSSSASTWYSRENTVIRVMQAPECKTHINLRHSKRLEKLVFRVSPFLCLDKKNIDWIISLLDILLLDIPSCTAPVHMYCYMYLQVNPVERSVGRSPPLIESPHVLKADLVTYQYYKVLGHYRVVRFISERTISRGGDYTCLLFFFSLFMIS